MCGFNKCISYIHILQLKIDFPWYLTLRIKNRATKVAKMEDISLYQFISISELSETSYFHLQ